MDWKVAVVRTLDRIPRTFRNMISNFRSQSKLLSSCVSNCSVEGPPIKIIYGYINRRFKRVGMPIPRYRLALTSRCRSVRVRLRDGGRGSPGRKRVDTGTTSRLLRQPGGGRYTLQNARSCESLTILSPFLRSLDKRTWTHTISSISRSHVLEYAELIFTWDNTCDILLKIKCDNNG